MKHPNQLIAALTGILMTASASAGGIYLSEYGQPGQGTSGAGNSVLAEDASTAFLNPSALFLLEGDSEWMVTGIVLDSSVKFKQDDQNTIQGNNGGDAGDTLVGGALFHTRKLNDDWGFAFSLNSTAGSALEYDDGFVGRYTGEDVDLLTVFFLPSVAYKVNDSFSVSAGIGAIYGEIELDQAIPPQLPNVPPAGTDGIVKFRDGDDWDATAIASATWQVFDTWRLALTYIGETELKFDGDLDVTLPIGISRNQISTDIELVLPQVLSLSSLYDLNDKLSLVARLGWEDWSELGSVPISTNQVGAEIPLNWDDTWSIGAGFRYKTGKRWNYYAGITYDSDPTEAEDRIAILPADRQIRYSGGFTYEIDKQRTIGGTLTYIDLGDARIRNEIGAGTFSGKYTTNDLYVFGVNYNWR
ncbi:MAG: OmpP1/FadL family transporter [Gammaproteobacteria bacterium]